MVIRAEVVDGDVQANVKVTGECSPQEAHALLTAGLLKLADVARMILALQGDLVETGSLKGDIRHGG